MRKKYHSSSFLICLLFIFLSWSIACSSGGGGNDSDSDPSHTEMLQSLGIDTELGSRKDINDNELADDYNPLGYKNGVLFKQSEIYAAGVGQNSKWNVLFQDGTPNDGITNYGVLWQESNADWDDSYPKKSIAADVDGDGLDEIIIAVHYTSSSEIAIRLVDRNNSITGEKYRFDHSGDLSDDLDGAAGGGEDWEDAFLRQDLFSGDVDGDGKDEIIILVGNYMYLLDDFSNGFALLKEKYFSGDAGEDTYLRGDAADFDIDGKDEIIVVDGRGFASRTAQYTIFDDMAADPDMTSPLVPESPVSTGGSTAKSLRAADVASGDFNGDGLMDIAFEGKAYDDEQSTYTMILQTSMDANSKPVFTFLEDYISEDNPLGYHFHGVAAGDIDGDRKDEIIAWQDIYVLDNGDIKVHDSWGNDAVQAREEGVCTYNNTTYVWECPFSDGSACNTELKCYDNSQLPSLDILAVGDVNGDRKDDVVFLTRDNLTIRIKSVDSNGDLSTRDLTVEEKSSTRPTLCLPNVDNDSAVLKYINHELLFTDPIVVAVLSSPPYWSGINGDGLGGTDFGSVKEYADSTEKSYGFSTSLTVGTGFDLPFGLGSAELTTTAEGSLNWGTSQTQSISEEWGYSTGVGEDKVLFTAIPFDVYYYEILSSPDPDQIGETIAINVPRAPGKYHQERNFYNAHNGDGYDVENSVIKHILGDPFSYADATTRDSLQNDYPDGLFSQHSLQVGTGNAYSAISITELSTEETWNSYEQSVTVAAEVNTQGFVAGVSASYNNGYTYTTSVGTGTYVQGQVPDIPANLYDGSMQFEWGLMAYPVVDSGQKFTFVTYWVD